MANSVLIMGDSGTGKSTSLRTLRPPETFVINVLDKPLPFKGFKKSYKALSEKNPHGNYMATDNAAQIIKLIADISKSRPEIKSIIIDDFQYVMANEFMRKAKEKGFEKFIDIGQQAWRIIRECTVSRSDLCIFILSHTETDSLGRSKCKTIGKMLDEKITLEGMFTIVLHSLIVDGQYKFLTQNDGVHIAKSPLGMFDLPLIENDLSKIQHKMIEYLNEDIEAEAADLKAQSEDAVLKIKQITETAKLIPFYKQLSENSFMKNDEVRKKIIGEFAVRRMELENAEKVSQQKKEFLKDESDESKDETPKGA